MGSSSQSTLEMSSQEHRNLQLDGTTSVTSTRPQRERRKSIKLEQQAYPDLSDDDDEEPFEEIAESDISAYEDDEHVV